MTAEHPSISDLSRDAYARMQRDERVTSGEWSETDWLWEEVRQLNAALNLVRRAVCP